MNWEVNYTVEFGSWWEDLNEMDQECLNAGIERLASRGPTLGRPHVDTLRASRHHNMKELRTRTGGRELRVLFAFDPRREAILLIGGDKTGRWTQWYEAMVPVADRIYDGYLEELRETGTI